MYELQVGNHLIRGKVADLPKPFIMTEKVINEVTGEISLKVVAIIRKKIIFSGRPTPIRTN